MREQGGLFGGERVVEVDDTSVAVEREGTVTRGAVPRALHERLREVTRQILDTQVPVAHRAVEVVDDSTTCIELEDGERRSTIRMHAADEPSEPVWALLALLDDACPDTPPGSADPH